MSLLQKSRMKASARQQINIRGVKDGVLQLPQNRFRLVLEVSAVNFELKSEDEQDALIETYESFLNSLPCRIQILVRIRELDMDKYLSNLDDQCSRETDAIYQNQIKHYSSFVEGLVASKKILSRQFYVVLPYDSHTNDFDSAKEQLALNADLVAKGLARLGMHSRRLGSLEVLDLFHSFYNPAQAKVQPLSGQVAQLITSSYIRKAEQ